MNQKIEEIPTQEMLLSAILKRLYALENAVRPVPDNKSSFGVEDKNKKMNYLTIGEMVVILMGLIAPMKI